MTDDWQMIALETENVGMMAGAGVGRSLEALGLMSFGTSVIVMEELMKTCGTIGRTNTNIS
jgi:hypothetical protein